MPMSRSSIWLAMAICAFVFLWCFLLMRSEAAEANMALTQKALAFAGYDYKTVWGEGAWLIPIAIVVAIAMAWFVVRRARQRRHSPRWCRISRERVAAPPSADSKAVLTGVPRYTAREGSSGLTARRWTVADGSHTRSSRSRSYCA